MFLISLGPLVMPLDAQGAGVHRLSGSDHC